MIQLTNKELHTVCQTFDFNNPPFNPIEFAVNLTKFMYDNNGIGLAANQVGVPYRIFSMQAAPENFVCFNPKLVTPSDEEIVLEEGCLSYPNILIKVKRPQHIRVRFQLPNGETLTKQFTGMTARIFQHELMHLDGNTFKNVCSRLVLDRAINKSNKKYNTQYTYSNF